MINAKVIYKEDYSFHIHITVDAKPRVFSEN